MPESRPLAPRALLCPRAHSCSHPPPFSRPAPPTHTVWWARRTTTTTTSTRASTSAPASTSPTTCLCARCWRRASSGWTDEHEKEDRQLPWKALRGLYVTPRSGNIWVENGVACNRPWCPCAQRESTGQSVAALVGRLGYTGRTGHGGLAVLQQRPVACALTDGCLLPLSIHRRLQV